MRCDAMRKRRELGTWLTIIRRSVWSRTGTKKLTKRVGPVRSFNILDAFKKGRSGYIDFPHDGIMEVGTLELRHFNVGETHICILKVGTIDRGIKEARPNEIAVFKIGVSDDGLLKGDSFQVLTVKVGSIEIDSAGNGNRSTRLERRSTTGSDLGVAGEFRARASGRISRKWRRDGDSSHQKGRQGDSFNTLEYAATGIGGRRRRQCGGSFMFGGTFERVTVHLS
jgi:hypothetical protein